MHIDLVYVETLLFFYCKNIIFYKMSVVFQILWTRLDFTIEVVLIFFQPAGSFEKSFQPDEIWLKAHFLRNSSRAACRFFKVGGPMTNQHKRCVFFISQLICSFYFTSWEEKRITLYKKYIYMLYT